MGQCCHSLLQYPLSPKPAWLGLNEGAGTAACSTLTGLSLAMVVGCPAGLHCHPVPTWALGPPLPCCPPAQPPHSSGALERQMKSSDPRARSTEPALSPNSARLGTGQPQPPVLQLVWPSGRPHTPLEQAFPTVPPEAAAPSALGALGRCVPPRRPMVLTSPTSSSVRQPPAASGASQPGPSPQGSPGSLPHAGLGVRAFSSPSLVSRTHCT